LAHVTPRFLIDRLGPQRGLLLAAALILVVGLADYATGYEVRLSILYLPPIAIATWTAGARMGVLAAACSSVLWLLSFKSQHFYLQSGYYYWEAAEMLFGFLAFAWLIARLRHALGQADERFFRVLEEMHSAVYVADESSDEILYANSAMIRIAGDAATSRASMLEQEFPHDGEGSASLPAITTGHGFSSRTIRNSRTGRWYLSQVGPIPWGRNTQVMLRVLSDITEEKDAELLREKHIEIMHRSAKLMSLAEIASTLAHEINQPLMVIATYADACQRLLNAPQPDHAEIASALAKCRAQAVRAASIIERLREFIRQRQHRPAPCDARSVVTDAIDIVQPYLDEQKIAIELPQAASGPVIVVDRILLVQALVNLIRNAIDAMRDTAPESRRLRIDIALQASGEVLFAVADRGAGFGTRSAEELLSPFFTTKADGLGLGLAICRTVATAHGGRLWAVDNPGGGAVFHLSIPAGSAA